MLRRAHCSGILLLSACLLGLASGAWAQGFAAVGKVSAWDHIFAGTRSESMGQGDLALAQGPMSIFNHPAPLPEARPFQVGYGNMEYIAGLEFHQYGLAAELGEFRLGFARMDLRSDDMLIRTAYNPEGTGETFKFDDRLEVLAASVDVAGLLAPASDWQWTFGLAYCRYRYSGVGEVIHADGVALGSAARYTGEQDTSRWSAGVSGVIRNVGDSDMMPQDTRFGLALTYAVDTERYDNVMAVKVGYVFVDDRQEEEFFGGRNYGAEMTLLEVLSVRLGHDERIFGGSSQYGLGLAVPRNLLGDFRLVIDWGKLGMGDFPLEAAERKMISATVTLDI